MEIRHALSSDLNAVMDVATTVLGPQRAGPMIRSHVERHHLLVANEGDEVVGVVAYRTDWFQCTMVSLVCGSARSRRPGAPSAPVTRRGRMPRRRPRPGSRGGPTAAATRMRPALGSRRSDPLAS